tara:strand:- start:2499 stop:2744 length:246 start_codon:yes stop_codon:yes gene_type:complete
MVENSKAKGSKSLKTSLPYGAIRKIAKVFGHSEVWVAAVISGKQSGNVLILECAEKIAELHFTETVKQSIILKGYSHGFNS